jgi:hypothetical protein
MTNQQDSIARQIRSFREDIALIDAESTDRAAMQIRCHAYNWATDPARMMTDKEHRVLRLFARIMLKQLQGRPGWHEMESGRLWC